MSSDCLGPEERRNLTDEIYIALIILIFTFISFIIRHINSLFDTMIRSIMSVLVSTSTFPRSFLAL